MDIEPHALGEQLLRDEQPVRAHDDGRRNEVEPCLQSLGLKHGDAEALRDELRRRGGEAAAPARAERRDA